MRPTLRLPARQCCVADTPARLAIDAGACTVVGSRRVNNEDSHYVDSEGYVFVVADGIGGASAGERASRMAVDLIPRYVTSVVTEADASEEEVLARIRDAFADTNAAILKAARQTMQFHRMGTTAVMALFIGPRLYVASIGDSRAYLVRGDRIEQLTADHTMAQALVEAGAISHKQALRHQWRNVLSKHLGSEEADNAPDLRVVVLQGNDQIVLATDGLTDVVDDRTMLHILQENRDAQAAATALIQAAVQKNVRDDATCVVLCVQEPYGPASPEWSHDSEVGIRLASRN